MAGATAERLTIATTPGERRPFRSVGHDRPVLYLIGGAPRCGKTLLAQQVASDLGAGWCSTDTVRDVVAMLRPDVGVAGGVGVPPGPEADRFFPYLERMAESCAYLAEDYVVEGVGFLPRHVAALASWVERRVVFVGMVEPRLDAILAHEGRNRWHRHLPPETLADLPAWIADWSRTLRDECANNDMPYVDLSADFDAGKHDAERALLGR